MREERREKEGREVDYAAACCQALCCLVLSTIFLLFEAFDLPQWFHVFFCFSQLFQALLQISSYISFTHQVGLSCKSA